MHARGFFAAAIALFALAAGIGARGEPGPRPPARVAFPRAPRPAEDARNHARRTLPPPPSPSPDDAPSLERDPLLTAIPRFRGSTVLVFEAKALAKDRAPRRLLACLWERAHLADFEAIERRMEIDRVGVSSDGIGAISGRFPPARWQAFGGARRPFGKKAMILERPGEAGPLAAWGAELVLFGRDLPTLEAAIDRLEDRSPAWPTLSDGASYGDVHGVVAVDDLAALAEGEPDLVARAESAVREAEVHVDLGEPTVITIDALGPEPDAIRALARSAGARIAGARSRAASAGDATFAALLEEARVRPYDGRMTLDLALPEAAAERALGACAKPPPDAR